MKMKFLCFSLLVATIWAQDRPIPPPGVAVSEADQKELKAGIERLSGLIAGLGNHTLLPDVIIFRDAARFALENNEFFRPDEPAKARALLTEGVNRAEALRNGEAPWTRATGLVVRGYVSKIDGSVQPYGLVVPPSYDARLPRSWRLDAWFHGRAEQLSEVNFLSERMSRSGEFTPRDAIVLHLYGRYCNANKFAGEIDLFEALEAVKKQYRIDDNRIVMRGFSMGGAAAWHIGAHYAGQWVAVAPGAGFSESREFLKLKEMPPVWEQKLWRMYDATDYAANFTNVPLVAYSGEIDGQKQAADLMAKYLEKEGIPMTHVIGPQTGHRYHPGAREELNQKIDAIAAQGREAYPRRVRFVTYTLRYNRMKWVTVDGLAQHWEKGSVDAMIAGAGVEVKTAGVTGLTLAFGPGGAPVELVGRTAVTIDGKRIDLTGPASDRSWKVSFVKQGGQWVAGSATGLRKVHGLQGPIDDAFMDSFLIVTGSGKSSERIEAEQARAIKEWRRQFRGEARVKKDSEVTEADLAAHHIVVWGTPASNSLLAKMADRLPVQWAGEQVKVGAAAYSAATHYPAFVYPNPLNPTRYVVVNSGFTFREFDYLNNARQISKLPDWAVIDSTTPADGKYPGKVVSAGFFDEQWKLTPGSPR
jgi:dienelactone hydrolase